MWKVLRWSGRRSDKMRTVYEGRDASKARAAFKKIGDALRQGEALLLCPDGTSEHTFAPNLRTRW